jgi:hypothetical protein
MKGYPFLKDATLTRDRTLGMVRCFIPYWSHKNLSPTEDNWICGDTRYYSVITHISLIRFSIGHDLPWYQNFVPCQLSFIKPTYWRQIVTWPYLETHGLYMVLERVPWMMMSIFFLMLNTYLAKSYHTWGCVLKCLALPRNTWLEYFISHKHPSSLNASFESKSCTWTFAVIFFSVSKKAP